jgi:hypothetical protein
MEQYIPKSALVAEIERRLKIHFNDYHINGNNSPADYGACNALTQILAFIDSLEVKEVDLEKIKRDWRNKGYIDGRKQALIPARKLGLPKSLNIIDMKEVKAAAKAWSEDDENTRGCDYIGAAVAERAFVACAEWLINKAQKGEEV